MDYKVIFLENIDSTNVYLKKLCKMGSPEEGTVILADYQSKGKGQGANSWHSTIGMNITMSMLFRPSVKASDHFYLSEFVSLGICDTLLHFGIESTIKWPNDIYVENRKIAGILVENSIRGENIFQVVVGIGLNVNETDFPDYIPNPVSMSMIKMKNFDRQEVLNVLISKLISRYKYIINNEYDFLHFQYNELLFQKGILTGFYLGDDTFQATLSKVETSGELLLIKQDGNEQRYMHGEIQMII
jgi:BirA family transcriptional regulator, biotin operon repressor / biotin---[acetyl-CoA-carboxylase] ligase